MVFFRLWNYVVNRFFYFQDGFCRNLASNMIREIQEGKLSAEEYAESIDIYMVVTWALQAVENVNSTTIINCFRHCGIKHDNVLVSSEVQEIEIPSAILLVVKDLVLFGLISFMISSVIICEDVFVSQLSSLKHNMTRLCRHICYS